MLSTTPFFGFFGLGHLVAQLHFEALLGQQFLELCRHFIIGAGHQTVQELNHGNFCTKAMPYATQFQPDNAATNNHQTLGHFRQFKRTCGSDNNFFVHLNTRQVCAVAPAGNNDVFGGYRLAVHTQAACAFNLAVAFKPGDAVFLEKEFNPFHVGTNNVGLAGLHFGQIKLYAINQHAMGSKIMPCCMIVF